MKIGIDLRSLQTVSQFRGIGYYTYNIVKALCKTDSSNEYLFFANEYNNSDKFPLLDTLIRETKKPLRMIPVTKTDGLDWRRFWEGLSTPIFYDLESIDILHIPSLFEDQVLIGMFPFNGKFVVTVHDWIPLTIRKLYYDVLPFEWKKHYMQRLNALKIYGDGIIAVSEYTRQDTIKLANCTPDRIDVVYHGVIDNSYIVKDKNLLKEKMNKLGITGKFILFTAAEDERKNFKKLIKAFSIFQKKKIGKYQLVIVGSSSLRWQEKQLELGKELKIDKDSLIFTGFVSDDDLKMIYNSATLFVFPSLYEGFGLPVLEAMSYGTPVIAANNSSIPEVAGDAALLFDAQNEVELAQKMSDLLSSDNLQNELREKGYKNIKRFSWEKAAKQTLAVYSKAAK